MTTPFKFDIECEVFTKSGPDGLERRIGGIVSTDHMDRQQERILQEGLDFGPFLKGGWFNDNHDSATDAVVGYPEKAELRTLSDGAQAWYVEGHLLPEGHGRSDAIWSLANSLQKTDRRLGFSVEGSIQERDPDDPNTIKRAVVREVAITRCPVNENTQLSILAKSLSAGSAIANPGTAPGEGFPLRTESLEGGDEKKKKRKKKLRRSEAIELLMRLNKSLSRDYAERIVDYAVRWHPAT